MESMMEVRDMKQRSGVPSQPPALAKGKKLCIRWVSWALPHVEECDGDGKQAVIEAFRPSKLHMG
eukprot:1158705-Pelagomonas_calceolata.AAC.18